MGPFQALQNGAHVVVVQVGEHRIVDVRGVRELGHEVFQVDGKPLTGAFAAVRVLRVFLLAVVARVDEHRRPVGHDDERGVAAAGRYGMDVEVSFLPFGQVFLCGKGGGQERQRKGDEGLFHMGADDLAAKIPPFCNSGNYFVFLLEMMIL